MYLQKSVNLKVMFRKLLIFILSFNVLFLSLGGPLAKTASAQTEPTWFRQDFPDWYVKVYDTDGGSPADEIFGERYTAAQVEWVVWGLVAFLFNHILPPETAVCILENPEDIDARNDCLGETLGPIMDSIVGQMVADNGSDQHSSLASSNLNKSVLSMVFEDRPLSGIAYVRQKINPVKEVYAQQGFGFQSLGFIQGLWRGARDVSFFLLILATIVMAFMVMFRVKLSPQTSISVQSAIPKVVFAIILITFSYAIAGFLVDLVYVVIGIFSSLFDAALPDIPLVNEAGIYYRMMTEGIPFFGGGVFGLMIIYIPLFFVSFLVSITAQAGAFAVIPAILVITYFLTILITILVIFTLILVSVKIVWMLVKTMVAVILLVITGPFYILGGTVLPGFGFGSWIKQLIANLMVYPVTGAMFMLAYIFLGWGMRQTFLNIVGLDNLAVFFQRVGIDTDLSGLAWQPPLLNFDGNGAQGMLFCFLSLSVLFLIPKLTDIIKGLISGRPYAYGTGIGEALGPVTGFGMAGAAYALGAPGARLASLQAAQRSGSNISAETLMRAERLARASNVIGQVFGLGGSKKK